MSVEHARSDFRECFGENIEDFLESVYVAGADLSGTDIEERPNVSNEATKCCIVNMNIAHWMKLLKL